MPHANVSSLRDVGKQTGHFSRQSLPWNKLEKWAAIDAGMDVLKHLFIILSARHPVKDLLMEEPANEQDCRLHGVGVMIKGSTEAFLGCISPLCLNFTMN